MTDVRRRTVIGGGLAGAALLAGCSSEKEEPVSAGETGGGRKPPSTTTTTRPAGKPIGDGSTSDTGPQPHQPRWTRLKPGEKPPQFVVISWDGGGETSLKLNSHFQQVAKRHGASMTYFLTGIYFLPGGKKMLYSPPRKKQGASDIGYFPDRFVRSTIEQIGKAWLAGHEIGTHFNGHFCGEKGVASWSVEDWKSEIEQAKKFVKTWRTNTGITDLPALPFDYEKELVGGRAPCPPRARLPVLGEELGDDLRDAVRQNPHGPPEVARRVVHDALPRVAPRLHRKARAPTQRQRALALPGSERVGRVVDVRHRRNGKGLFVRPRAGRQREVQPLCRKAVARRLERDRRHAKRHAQEAREHAAETVPGDPHLAIGELVGQVVVQVGRRRVVQRALQQRTAHARAIAPVRVVRTPTHRRPVGAHARTAAREQQVVVLLVALPRLPARQEGGARPLERHDHHARVVHAENVAP